MLIRDKGAEQKALNELGPEPKAWIGLTADVKAGKFKTLDQAIEEMRRRLLAAGMSDSFKLGVYLAKPGCKERVLSVHKKDKVILGLGFDEFPERENPAGIEPGPLFAFAQHMDADAVIAGGFEHPLSALKEGLGKEERSTHKCLAEVGQFGMLNE